MAERTIVTPERLYLASFTENFRLYCRKQGINMSSVFRAVKSKRKVSLNEDKFNNLRKCNYRFAVPFYLLVAMCEEIGLSLEDFMPLRLPDKEPLGIDPIHLHKGKRARKKV